MRKINRIIIMCSLFILLISMVSSTYGMIDVAKACKQLDQNECHGRRCSGTWCSSWGGLDTCVGGCTCQEPYKYKECGIW